MTIEITGQQAKVSVGEKIKLGVKFNVGWGILQSVEWKIPGTIVKNYVDGQASAKVTKIEEADKKKFTIEFYWVDGGDGRTVEAACVFKTMAGTETKKTVSAKFDVKRPKIEKFTSTTDTVGLIPAVSPTDLGFGVLAAGIIWHWKINANSAATGKIKDIQLWSPDRRRTTIAGKKQIFTLPGMKVPSGWVLDNENPYGSVAFWGIIGGPWPLLSGGSVSDSGISDSPQTPFQGNRKSSDESFKYFLMYQSDKADSIWIPIGVLEWNWNGVATKGVSGWSLLVTGRAPNSVNPVGGETFEFPLWDHVGPNDLTWEDE